MIEHVCIVGQVGFTEAEATRGCVDGCATCGAMTEDYLRVDGRLLCPRCAARMWTVERETHAELATERTKDVRRIIEENSCKDFVLRGTPEGCAADGACLGTGWWNCAECGRMHNSSDRESLIVRAREHERCHACGLAPMGFQWVPMRTPDEGPIEAMRCSCANGHRWTAQGHFVPVKE